MLPLDAATHTDATELRNDTNTYSALRGLRGNRRTTAIATTSNRTISNSRPRAHKRTHTQPMFSRMRTIASISWSETVGCQPTSQSQQPWLMPSSSSSSSSPPSLPPSPLPPLIFPYSTRYSVAPWFFVSSLGALLIGIYACANDVIGIVVVTWQLQHTIGRWLDSTLLTRRAIWLSGFYSLFSSAFCQIAVSGNLWLEDQTIGWVIDLLTDWIDWLVWLALLFGWIEWLNWWLFLNGRSIDSLIYCLIDCLIGCLPIDKLTDKSVGDL